MREVLEILAGFLGAALLALGALRVGRAAGRGVRPFGYAAGAVAVVLSGLSVAGLVGLHRFKSPAATPPPALRVEGTPERLERGRRLANLCTGCHAQSPSGPLSGGGENHFAGIGTLVAPNLTPAGLAEWTDGEILRALRKGVHRDGRALLIMPSDQYRVMSDSDAHALIAYLRELPSESRATPPTRLGFFGLALFGLGVLPSSVQEGVRSTVPEPPTDDPREYGRYLVRISGCAACHGDDLRGGDGEFTPRGPDLIEAVHRWESSDFLRVIRTGITPGGAVLDPGQMPWASYSAAFHDEELAAMYRYIEGLAAAG